MRQLKSARYVIINNIFENNLSNKGGAVFADNVEFITLEDNYFLNNSAVHNELVYKSG